MIYHLNFNINFFYPKLKIYRPNKKVYRLNLKM